MEHSDRDSTIRAAFAEQAGHCRRLGSAFTALLCETLGRHLDRGSAVGRRVLDWPGQPESAGDALPLRLAGGLNALVRAGRLPDLASLYPPNPLPSEDALWASLRAVLDDPALLPWLDLAPQTNEVGRSAVLMAGLQVIAAQTNLPLALYELGASAGLNLILDRYAYRLGARSFGPPDAPLQLAPDWSGGDPPQADIRIVSREGVDLNALDVTAAADRDRLLAYVWPDQPERVARLEAALASAAADPPALEKGDAAAWLEHRIRREAQPGIARIVLHSIAFQYFPDETQRRITARMEEAGAAAGPDTPLAWLRYEHEPEAGRATLRLRLWPDGEDRLLAYAHPHGRSVEWLG